jgi:hypothetical protein
MKKAIEEGAYPDQFFEGFITTTVNGKSTQRTLNIFGMEAYAVKEIPQGRSVTLLVRRLRNDEGCSDQPAARWRQVEIAPGTHRYLPKSDRCLV